MKQMITQNFKQLIGFLKKNVTRERLPYIAIVILVLLSSAANLLPNPKLPDNNISGISTPTPNQGNSLLSPPQSQTKQLEIISYTPINNSKPTMADTLNPVSITFNRTLTNTQISNLQIVSIPEMTFKKIAHTNMKTVFFRPFSPWKNNASYLIIINSPDMKTFSFKFTPTDKVNLDDVMVGTESL